MTQIRRSQRFVCLVSVLALLAGASPILAVTVEEIPSPRPAGWSVDLTGTIPAETRLEIDHLSDQVKAANGAEIAVVVIDSTGGIPSRDFATRLFDHWGIGEKDKDNGILLLAALNDHRAEIVLGRGLDNSANNQASEEIMQGEIVPRFRAGDPGGALLEGSRTCARQILNVDVAPLPAEAASPLRPLAEAPTQPPSVASTQERPDPDRYAGIVLATLAGLGLIGAGGFLMRAPRCSQCRIAMTLLDEREDDAHLTPAERTEERIGSVNYEIWVCPQCGKTKKRSWTRLFSGYSRCSSCGAKAVQSTSLVIERPTYSSSGTKRVSTSCAQCGRKSSSTVAIPRLERPRPATSSSSSSWLSSSRRFSSGGSSSSSHSSSRSSGFGGGRSSGGGASGKW